ncbi:MAG: NUDIX domain-containing protein [bacterium]|nr:NUDIX domain-containing protein [bacterium]
MSIFPTPSGPEKVTYQGKIIEVVEQPMKIGEKSLTFEFARRAPGTRLIIPTSDGKIILTKEYRPEIKGYDYRLPGGKVFDTLKEYNSFLKTNGDIKAKAREAAVKEAREEVALIASDAELFGISKCGTTVEWDLYYFVINSYTKEAQQDLEAGENITIVPTTLAEAKKMCLNGSIQEERSALMLLRYLNK